MVVIRAIGLEGAPVAFCGSDQPIVRILFCRADVQVEGNRILELLGSPQAVSITLVGLDDFHFSDGLVQDFQPHHQHREGAVGIADHGLGGNISQYRVGDIKPVVD
jgi:hypothetical protein